MKCRADFPSNWVILAGVKERASEILRPVWKRRRIGSESLSSFLVFFASSARR